MTNQAFRVLRYPGTAIGVDGGKEDIRWLVQFLRPSFVSKKDGVVDWSVKMVRNGPAFERLLKRGPDPRRRRRPGFFLDSRVETLPLWNGPGGTVTVLDRVHGVFASVRPDGKGVGLVAPERARLSRLGLMRIVREYVLSRLMGLEGLLLHASAIVVDGRAVLVLGEKRSGKSSLMLHALGGSGELPAQVGESVQFMANDRVWVSTGGGRNVGRGFPTISSLRVSSLELFPNVQRELEGSTFSPAATLAESRLRSATPSRAWKGKKFTLSPPQLCQLLGVKGAVTAPVGTLLFPRVTGVGGRIRLRRLGPPEAAEALRAGLFRAGTPQKSGGVFGATGYPRRIDEETISRRIQEIVHGSPCFSVDLGTRAYSDPSWLERLGEKISG